VVCDLYTADHKEAAFEYELFKIANPDYSEEALQEAWSRDEEYEEPPFYEEEGELPSPVRSWLTITPEEERHYIRLNDDQGEPFEGIADAVEANHPEVFRESFQRA
jgi:hypothetical protein